MSRDVVDLTPEQERLLWVSAINCRWCTRLIVPCMVDNCRGWGGRSGERCGGWMHIDLFHGCQDGQHQAAPELDGPQ